MNKKLAIVLVIVFVAAILVVAGLRFLSGDEDTWLCVNNVWVKHGQPSAPAPTTSCGQEEKMFIGRISALSKDEIKIVDDSNQTGSFWINSQTKFFDKENKPIDFSYLRIGFVVKIIRYTGGDIMQPAREVQVAVEPNIIVFEPVAGSEVGLPLVIKGEARVFENNFNYRIKDQDGTVIFENYATANAPDIGQYGPFNLSVSYPKPNSQTGWIEVFDYSAKDGQEENVVLIPVKFKDTAATEVEVYFSNTQKDPGATDCQRVFSVKRRVAKTTALARSAVEQLLIGPSTLEAREGYVTNINERVKIQSLTIENGTAKIDFNDLLEQAVGGSCRVAAIRSQIAQTLKQFPSVNNVIISINGRTEDILQP